MPTRVFRFDRFELNEASGELRHGDTVTRLQEKPLRALVRLLECPGTVVTREELSACLWPGNVHVDFEQGLGNAILKIRDALGDSATSPRYVETLPRRGYRFIAAVTCGRRPEMRQNPRLVDWLRRAVVATLLASLIAAAGSTWRPTTAGSLPADPIAREEFLRAGRLAERKTPDGLAKSVEAYQVVLARVPDFAPAWAGLAESIHYLGAVGSISHRRAYERTRQAAMHAIALDDSLARAHAILAETTFRFGPDGGEAMTGFDRAIALAPESATIHQMRANYRAHQGDLTGALDEMRLAHELDPVSLHINVDLAALLYEAGQREAAIDRARRTLDLDPYYPKAHMLLGRIQLREGDVTAAIDTFRRAIASAPDVPKFQHELDSAYERAAREGLLSGIH